MADVLAKVYDLAFAEVEKISKKDELTKESLCVLNDTIDILKDIGEIMRQEYDREEAMDGYSRRSSYRPAYYNDGHSYARGRMGRNSYDDGRDMMIEHLTRAMEKASSDSDRNAIRQMIEKMENG